jgi:hypothetical protein
MGLQFGAISIVLSFASTYATVVGHVTGNCKTEASRKPVVMDEHVAPALMAWRQEKRVHSSHRLGLGFAAEAGASATGGLPRLCGTTSSRQPDGLAIDKKIGWHPSGIRFDFD